MEKSGLKCHLSVEEALESGTCECGGPHLFYFILFYLEVEVWVNACEKTLTSNNVKKSE